MPSQSHEQSLDHIRTPLTQSAHPKAHPSASPKRRASAASESFHHHSIIPSLLSFCQASTPCPQEPTSPRARWFVGPAVATTVHAHQGARRSGTPSSNTSLPAWQCNSRNSVQAGATRLRQTWKSSFWMLWDTGIQRPFWIFSPHKPDLLKILHTAGSSCSTAFINWPLMLLSNSTSRTLSLKANMIKHETSSNKFIIGNCFRLFQSFETLVHFSFRSKSGSAQAQEASPAIGMKYHHQIVRVHPCHSIWFTNLRAVLLQ